jgi:hypothetical protein
MNDIQQPRTWYWRRALLVLAVCLGLSAVAGELGIRLKDLVSEGTAFLSNPTYESALRMRRFGIWVGRPGAHFQKWKMNSFGFRSEEISFTKRDGCTRIMVLGSSEMFGLYESPGNDFSAVLTNDLRSAGCFEVINGSMAGMSLSSILHYWNSYLVRFRPDIVIVYPSPDINVQVYLQQQSAPKHTPAPVQPADPVPAIHSRLLDYLHGFIHVPQAIDDWRTRRAIAKESRAHPSNWQILHVPRSVVDGYGTQLQALVDPITASGAQAIFITHALRVTSNSPTTDPHAALWLQALGPRVSFDAWLEFNRLANARLEDFAHSRHLAVVDLDQLLTGCRACFVDAAHFTDMGAKRAADTATRAVLSLDHSAPIKSDPYALSHGATSNYSAVTNIGDGRILKK